MEIIRRNLLVGAALFTAVLPAAELHVAVSATPVTVDGKMSEYVYVGYDWSQPFIVFDRENAVTNGLYEPVGKPFSALGTQGGVFTDTTNLYVAVLAPCDEQHPAGAADGVGVAVSPDAKTVFVVECGTNRKCVASRIGADGTRVPIVAPGVKRSQCRQAFFLRGDSHSLRGARPDAGRWRRGVEMQHLPQRAELRRHKLVGAGAGRHVQHRSLRGYCLW